MKKINRILTLVNLMNQQNSIHYESDEDEGAMEHHAELQSVIDSIKDGNVDDAILVDAVYVGQEHRLVYE